MWFAALRASTRYGLSWGAGGTAHRRSDKAEVLFVVDNSASMIEETVGLAENFHGWVLRLEGARIA